MKRSHKKAAGIVAAIGLGFAAAAFAHPGQMGDGNGPHAGMGGMQHGRMGAGQSLMTPEERSALQEKMHDAKTPEERQKLAQETHDAMQKRAQEKGLTLPQHAGPEHTH